MAINASAVEILIEKSKFAPDVALGVAEAIDLAMTQAQFVTVAVFDARIQEVRSDIRVLEQSIDAKLERMRTHIERMRTDLERMRADIVRWVFLVMLGSVAVSLSAQGILGALKGL